MCRVGSTIRRDCPRGGLLVCSPGTVGLGCVQLYLMSRGTSAFIRRFDSWAAAAQTTSISRAQKREVRGETEDSTASPTYCRRAWCPRVGILLFWLDRSAGFL